MDQGCNAKPEVRVEKDTGAFVGLRVRAVTRDGNAFYKGLLYLAEGFGLY